MLSHMDTHTGIYGDVKECIFTTFCCEPAIKVEKLQSSMLMYGAFSIQYNFMHAVHKFLRLITRKLLTL